MKKIIISDTTTLITLAKTNQLYLLTNLIDTIYIPNAVMEEIDYKDDYAKSIIEKSDFIEIREVTNKSILRETQLTNLDRGETEAISLALETNLGLIIDEKLGRRYAESKGIKIIGLLGILKSNLIRNHISYIDLLYILNECKNAKFRLGARLEKDFLESLSKYAK